MTWQVKVDVTCAGEPHVSASFSRSPITLGTGPDNDIVLSAPHISRRHAEVMVSRGGLVLRDTSRNGCFVDGRRVGSELALGQRGVIGVPPFEIALIYDGEEPVWQTAYRDLAHLVPPAQQAAPGAPEPEPRIETPANPTPTAPLPTLTGRNGPTRRPRHDAAAQVPKATLEVVEGPEGLCGRTFEVPANRLLVVGRGGDAAVVLPHRTVSRRHAEMILRDDVLAVRDLASANGVWHNGDRIKTARAEVGERLAFGEVVLELRGARTGNTDHLRAPLEATAYPIGNHDDRLLLVFRGAAISAHRATLTRALEVVDDARIRGLVIDLSSVVMIGDFALSCFAQTAASLERRGGALILAGARRAVSNAMASHPSGSHLRERMAIDGASGTSALAKLL